MRKLFLFLVSVLAMIGCSDKDPSTIIVDPGFSVYVSAFTTGVISCQSNIKVILVEPHPDAVAGEPISTDLFDFEPSIEGTSYWVDNQTIEFRPAKNLPSGQSYVASFKLKELIATTSEFETMKFGFVVIRQSLFVSFDGVRSTDVNDFSKQELFGTVRTTDNANPEDLQKCLTATHNGKSMEISWEHPEGSKSHIFTVKGVQRTEKQSNLILKWNGETIGADVSDDMDITIPSLSDFVVMQVRTVQSPGLYFSVQFSDPVDPKQDLNGLIYLRSSKSLRFIISNNEVKVYPLDQLESEETIVIEQSVVNLKGTRLKEQFEKVVEFNLASPAIELIGDGVIMPTVGKTSFPFKAINLKAVNFRVLKVYENNVNQFFQVNQIDGNSELTRVGRLVYDGVIDLVSQEAIDYGSWNTFNIDLSNIIDPAPGSIYRVLISFEKNQSLFPCGDTLSDVQPMKRRDLNFDDNSYFDDDMWYGGWYDYDEIENPCSDSYYKYYGRSKSANIFSSNIGIIAKESADNVYTVITTDLRTTEPLSGVEVEAYNFQNQLIGSGSTNGEGIAQFQAKGVPYLIVAKEGAQRGYLRVDKGSALSVSLYDVGGSQVEKGVKGFIYGERGVWRPGDTLFLSFMLEDKLNALPETHPIIMELYDPLGKLFDKKVKTKGVHGLYNFKFVTDPLSVTGKWQAKAIVGNSIFTTTLKVETIKPNRLKIDFDFANLITSSQDLSTTLHAKWMYGAPGANLNTDIEMSVSAIKTVFDKYEGFMFDDMTVNFYQEDALIVESKTNAEGNARVSFDWNRPKSAPGMLKLSFNTKVYEPGGDFSQDFMSKKYSPFRSYAGIKMDKGTNWLTAYDTEKSNAVFIASVDENGKPLNRKMRIELYKMQWNWWWESDGDDEVTQYVNRESITLIKSDAFTVSNGKGTYDLTFPEAGWGRYMLRVVDTESGHSSSQIFFGKYSSWYNDNSGGDNTAATALSIETGKDQYNTGEKMEITVPSGGLGSIYVTVEKGDKILQQMWVKATENSTTFSIDATPEMCPNVYINAVLIQPHGQDKNSLPIRMYGVIPVKVYDVQTRLDPVISCPATVKPEGSFKVNVTEKSGKPMAYSLAVVDEGLLSLTRFNTPEAWPVFYSKEALKIRSWDMYKYVMSALTGKMVPLLAVGGDEGLNYKDDVSANRFKPVVTYLGPFYLEKGGKASHDVHIPNYIGAVRVMVVAGIDGAYGSTEKEVQVKQPLMVLSTLPRVLGPSEKVRIPINIISMDDNIKEVLVKVSSNDLLRPLGAVQQTIAFQKSGEKTVYFEYEVARKLGVATFKVTLSAGKEQAFENVEIIVRPPNPLITNADSKALQPNESWLNDYTAIGVTGSNSASLQLSSIPDLNLEKHLKYLIQYPHGCIEQTTSGVFPQLYLGAFVKLNDAQKDEINKNIIAGLNRLKTFQITSGGLSYWPGSDYPSDWGTNYAGHFIVEAKAKGYEIPVGLLEGWLKYQKNEASNWSRYRNQHYAYYGDDLIQAYRLYTLALAGDADLSAMNRLRSDANLTNMAAWRLAAAYAITGSEDAARDLATRSRVVQPYREMSYSYGSDVRDLAMILETMFYLNDKTNGLSVINDLAQRLNGGWHSTQSRAYALLAIAKYIGYSDKGPKFSASLIVNGKNIKIESESPVWSMEISKDQLNSGNIQITNNSSQILFASLVKSGIPIEANEVPANKDLSMQIDYQDLKGNPISVQSISQGQDFKAIVTVSHQSVRDDYKEMALSQVFPSGWQIVNTRVGDMDASSSSTFTYQDIRDDRVYTYFDLKRGERKQFEILLNATFVGRYYMPAVFCAPMYDESVQALKPGQWVEVIATKQ